MKHSGLGKKIEKFGYDINLLPNLVFIPCTLQGACYLGVQPHRGNHTAKVDQDDYDDDSEPKSYHDIVSRKIVALQLPLDKACSGRDDARIQEIQGKLDSLSKDLTNMIQRKPTEAPLTTLPAIFHQEILSGAEAWTRSNRTKACSTAPSTGCTVATVRVLRKEKKILGSGRNNLINLSLEDSHAELRRRLLFHP
jgi:hypothetical protein